MSRRVVSGLQTMAVLLCALGPAGCSSPPQKEREQAEAAITAARAADADAYAREELQAAIAQLSEYDRAVAQGDYRLALSHALSARDGALNAASVARERKAAARSEAERLIVDFEGLVIVARSRLGGSPPALSPAAMRRTRATVKTYATRLQEARSLLTKEDFKGVVALLQSVVDTLRKDVTPPAGRRGK
jgi:hypothetical protein